MSRERWRKESEESKPRVDESLCLISFVCADVDGKEIFFDGSEWWFRDGDAAKLQYIDLEFNTLDIF